jgi:hypothetical protein
LTNLSYIFFEHFADFDRGFGSFQVSLDHIRCDLLELGCYLRCDQSDLLENKVILFSEFSIYFEKIFYGQWIERFFLDVIFDKQPQKR